MRHQGLHAAERFGQRDATQPTQELPDGWNAARQFEGDDGAKPALLARRQRVTRVRAQSRIPDPTDSALQRQPFGQRLRVAAVDGEPCVQRAQATQGQVTVEGRAGHP